MRKLWISLAPVRNYSTTLLESDMTIADDVLQPCDGTITISEHQIWVSSKQFDSQMRESKHHDTIRLPNQLIAVLSLLPQRAWECHC